MRLSATSVRIPPEPNVRRNPATLCAVAAPALRGGARARRRAREPRDGPARGARRQRAPAAAGARHEHREREGEGGAGRDVAEGRPRGRLRLRAARLRRAPDEPRQRAAPGGRPAADLRGRIAQGGRRPRREPASRRRGAATGWSRWTWSSRSGAASASSSRSTRRSRSGARASTSSRPTARRCAAARRRDRASPRTCSRPRCASRSRRPTLADAEQRRDDARLSLNELMGRDPTGAPRARAPAPPGGAGVGRSGGVAERAGGPRRGGAPPGPPRRTPSSRRPRRARASSSWATRASGRDDTTHPGSSQFWDRFWHDAGYSFALVFVWNVWDPGAARARIAQASLGLQQSRLALEVGRRDARLAWEKAHTALAHLYQQIEILSRAVPDARDSYLEAQSRYRGGAATRPRGPRRPFRRHGSRRSPQRDDRPLPRRRGRRRCAGARLEKTPSPARAAARRLPREADPPRRPRPILPRPRSPSRSRRPSRATLADVVSGPGRTAALAQQKIRAPVCRHAHRALGLRRRPGPPRRHARNDRLARQRGGARRSARDGARREDRRRNARTPPAPWSWPSAASCARP